MRIFVIGGTGFISSSLVRQLLHAGHDVTIFTRGMTSPSFVDHPGLTIATGDRRDRASLENAAREGASKGRFDAVYDMIAYRPEETRLAIEAFRDRADRFIHCSTISVYMVSDDVTCPITEDQDKAPLMDFWPRNPFGMEYGIHKRECEDLLWDAHEKGWHDVAMLRPPYVSGPGDPTIRDFFWIERILDGGPLLVPGMGKSEFQLVYVEDVGRAFASLLEHPEASSGRAYNVTDEEVITLNGYLRRIARLLGREENLELVHIPQDEFDELSFSTYPNADVFPFNTRRDAVFSLDRIKQDLGYESTPIDQWMRVMVEWYLVQEDLESHGYENRGKELAFLASR
jgi:nucleoside-diphosphate-sugar epimerase